MEEVDQYQCIINDAIFLSERLNVGYKIRLYHLNDFYIEVYYSTMLHFITRLTPFKTTKLLGPYLEQISVGEINGSL